MAESEVKNSSADSVLQTTAHSALHYTSSFVAAWYYRGFFVFFAWPWEESRFPLTVDAARLKLWRTWHTWLSFFDRRIKIGS